MEKLNPKYPTYTGEDLKRLKKEIKKLEKKKLFSPKEILIKILANEISSFTMTYFKLFNSF